MIAELEGWEGRRDVIFSLCGSMKEKGEMSSQGVEKGGDCRGNIRGFDMCEDMCGKTVISLSLINHGEYDLY